MMEELSGNCGVQPPPRPCGRRPSARRQKLEIPTGARDNNVDACRCDEALRPAAAFCSTIETDRHRQIVVDCWTIRGQPTFRERVPTRSTTWQPRDKMMTKGLGKHPGAHEV